MARKIVANASFFFFLVPLKPPKAFCNSADLQMPGVLETLYAPLEALGDLMGLSPPLVFLVVAMLATGSYVQWQFNHGKHDDDDHED